MFLNIPLIASVGKIVFDRNIKMAAREIEARVTVYSDLNTQTNSNPMDMKTVDEIIKVSNKGIHEDAKERPEK